METPNTTSNDIEGKIVAAITSSPCASKLTDDEIAEMTNKIITSLNGTSETMGDPEMESFTKSKTGILDKFAS